jgi:hypothetical protein
MSPAGGHLGFSIGPKINNTWLAACNDHFLKNHWMDWNHTWQKCSLQGLYQVLLLFVPIGYPIWLPGVIIASDWLKFQRSSSPILHGGWN